jgi:hypothetical protein
VVEHHDAIRQVHHDTHVVLDQRNRGAELIVHVEDEAGHVLLLFQIHSRHRLVEQQQFRPHGERAAELDALLQAVWQAADRDAPDLLNFEKVDDPLDGTTVFDFLVQGRADAKQLPEQAAVHLERASGHDVVERGHALEQRNVLERACDAAGGGFVRAHPVARRALEGDAALLRMIEAVDDVEHRRFARAVGADDGADFALADVERDIADRFHAAERERNIFH